MSIQRRYEVLQNGQVKTAREYLDLVRFRPKRSHDLPFVKDYLQRRNISKQRRLFQLVRDTAPIFFELKPTLTELTEFFSPTCFQQLNQIDPSLLKLAKKAGFTHQDIAKSLQPYHTEGSSQLSRKLLELEPSDTDVLFFCESLQIRDEAFWGRMSSSTPIEELIRFSQCMGSSGFEFSQILRTIRHPQNYIDAIRLTPQSHLDWTPDFEFFKTLQPSREDWNTLAETLFPIDTPNFDKLRRQVSCFILQHHLVESSRTSLLALSHCPEIPPILGGNLPALSIKDAKLLLHTTNTLPAHLEWFLLNFIVTLEPEPSTWSEIFGKITSWKNIIDKNSKTQRHPVDWSSRSGWIFAYKLLTQSYSQLDPETQWHYRATYQYFFRTTLFAFLSQTTGIHDLLHFLKTYKETFALYSLDPSDELQELIFQIKAKVLKGRWITHPSQWTALLVNDFKDIDNNSEMALENAVNLVVSSWKDTFLVQKVPLSPDVLDFLKQGPFSKMTVQQSKSLSQMKGSIRKLKLQVIALLLEKQIHPDKDPLFNYSLVNPSFSPTSSSSAKCVICADEISPQNGLHCQNPDCPWGICDMNELLGHIVNQLDAHSGTLPVTCTGALPEDTELQPHELVIPSSFWNFVEQTRPDGNAIRIRWTLQTLMAYYRHLQGDERTLPPQDRRHTFCPSEECRALRIWGDAEECSICRKDICAFCERSHPKLNCAQNSDPQYARDLEAIQQRLTNGTLKKCPKCQVVTEKNEGCDHMTCRKCKHEYYWSNGLTYGQPSTNVQRPQRRRH